VIHPLLCRSETKEVSQSPVLRVAVMLQH
jgi:hypothetical protein